MKGNSAAKVSAAFIRLKTGAHVADLLAVVENNFANAVNDAAAVAVLVEARRRTDSAHGMLDYLKAKGFRVVSR